MILSFQFADIVLTAVEQYKKCEPDGDSPSRHWLVSDGWFVTCSDALTGESRTVKHVKLEQLHAVISLAMGSGEEGFVDDSTVREFYALAELVVTGWPTSVRPIP